MTPEEARRLKELEVENARLKRLVVEKELFISIPREANERLRKPQARRGTGRSRLRLGEPAGNPRNGSIRRPRSRLADEGVLACTNPLLCAVFASETPVLLRLRRALLQHPARSFLQDFKLVSRA
jgi:hypothetical protein